MKRIISLDIIKIIAILSVIIAHTMLICKSDSNNLFTLKSATPFPKCYLHKEE